MQIIKTTSKEFQIQIRFLFQALDLGDKTCKWMPWTSRFLEVLKLNAQYISCKMSVNQLSLLSWPNIWAIILLNKLE